jgi:hypothetical protein
MPYEHFDPDKITHVGDEYHKGTDIYRSARTSEWVFVDLENHEVTFSLRFAVYASRRNGDETGLNENCVASDFSGPEGFWAVPLDWDEEADMYEPGVYLVFDSRYPEGA